MWPGDQSGGQPQGTPPQRPSGPYGQPEQPNPYATPAYQQPGPRQQPGYPPASPYRAAPPSPYAQPGYHQQPGQAQPGYPPQPPPPGYPAPQQWGRPLPGGPAGPPPPGGRGKLNIAVTITAAVAVVAAMTVGAVYFTGVDGRSDDAKDDRSPAPTATVSSTTPSPLSPSATASAFTGDDDSPRGAPDSLDVQPVVPGWQVVRRGERNVVFDVPPDWTVGSEGTTIGFEDNDGKPAVAMGAPAYYKHDWCQSGNGTADRAAVGTKGANGASSVRDAAEVQAESWAYWAYQDDGKGTFSKAQGSKAFHNAYGITGWQAQATASGIPKSTQCSADGEAWTVAWIDPAQTDPTQRLVVWVLYADRGVSDELAQATIDKIKSTIRLLKK